MISRRNFLQLTAATGILAGTGLLRPRRVYAFGQSPTNIPKFVNTLPGLTANNVGNYIPVATPTTQNFAGQPTDVYKLAVQEYYQQMDPALPNKTKLWGYADINVSGTPVNKYLGPAVVATRGRPVLFNITNSLPSQHILPVDNTIMAGPNGLMVGDLPYNRIATHLHGGLTPWFSDGTPFQWFTPAGMNYQAGVSFYNVPGTNPALGTATYYYPNDQSARLVWYHDHAIGITRLNAYSGIAAPYLITDAFETFLLKNHFLPDLVGVPLVIQDKLFFDGGTTDPNYPVIGAVPGSLWYPWEYDPGRWTYGPSDTPPAILDSSHQTLPTPSVVPEFFADITMVNGAPYPRLPVNAGTVRLRILNGSQARFWHLNLYLEDPSNPGEPLLNSPGPALYQIGTEGGFLPHVVKHPNGIPCPLDLTADPSGNTANPDGPFNLLLAPAERADVLVDFTGLGGRNFILYSDAPAPFPGGDPVNNYATPVNGPDTRTILRIEVSSTPGPKLPNLALLDLALLGNFTIGNVGVPPQQDPLLAPWNPITQQFVVLPGVPKFNKTLNEDYDDYGRLVQRGGTDVSLGKNNQGVATFGRDYLSTPTEVVSNGAIQVWDFYNTTGDTHPWHFHLVNVQVVGRGKYTPTTPGGNIPVFGSYTDLAGNHGKLTPPDPNEYGWKETVRMNPGEITRVIIQFNLPKLPKVMGDPKSPRTGGHEYVHHCHILEHEEHDMMRPLVVK